MPLRASIDGKEIIAPFLDDSEWNSLKNDISSGSKQAILPCCQNLGFLRTSKLGTKHFVHKRKSNCSWEPETEAHLKAKAAIVIACKNAGFNASTEVIGPDWIADVLVTKGSLKIAFEVQLSSQNTSKTLERHNKYIRDGIICCWLFSRIPLELINSNLACFEITQSHEKFVVYLNTLLPIEKRKSNYGRLHEYRIIRNSCFNTGQNGELIYHELKQKIEPEDWWEEYEFFKMRNAPGFWKFKEKWKRFKINYIELYLTDFVEGFLLEKIKFNGDYWCYSEKLDF